MRSDPAPFVAKLFLFKYESKLVLQTKKSNLQKEGKFCFIDDLCPINDNSEFEKKIKEIYLPELVLKKKAPQI